MNYFDICKFFVKYFLKCHRFTDLPKRRKDTKKKTKATDSMIERRAEALRY